MFRKHFNASDLHDTPENVTAAAAYPETDSDIISVSNAMDHSLTALRSANNRLNHLDLPLSDCPRFGAMRNDGRALWALFKMTYRMLISLSLTLLVTNFVLPSLVFCLMIDL